MCVFVLCANACVCVRFCARVSGRQSSAHMCATRLWHCGVPSFSSVALARRAAVRAGGLRRIQRRPPRCCRLCGRTTGHAPGSAAALALSQSPAPNTLHFLATQSAGAAAAAAAALPRLAALMCWHHRAPPAVCCCVFMFTRTWCRQLPHAPHLAMRTHHQPPVYPRLCPAPGACTESQASHRPGRISLFHPGRKCMHADHASAGRTRARRSTQTPLYITETPSQEPRTASLFKNVQTARRVPQVQRSHLTPPASGLHSRRAVVRPPAR